MFACGPISWQSKQQKTITLSTMDAEYMSACAAAEEAIRLQWREMDLWFSMKTINFALPLPRAMKIVVSPSIFVNEKIAENQIVMKHVATEVQLADMSTKTLAPPTYVKLAVMMLGEWLETKTKKIYVQYLIYVQRCFSGLSE